LIGYERWRLEHWGRRVHFAGATGSDFDELASYLPVRSDVPCLASTERLIMYDPRQLAQAVRKIWPETHVLITTRNPRDYLMSSFHNSSLKNVASAKVFSNRFAKRHMSVVYRFDELLEAYGAVFGRDNVHFLPYELLCDSPESYQARLCEILQFPIGEFLPKTRKNASPPPAFLLIVRRINELLAAEAPNLLKSRDWQTFLRFATEAAASAKGSDEFYAEFLSDEVEITEALPRLAPEFEKQLAERMGVLKSVPDYAPYRRSYGFGEHAG
jgi:hypothetical protein